MPKRKLKSALRSASEELNSITDLILLLQERKREDERQRIEDEAAGRKEKRAEERLGLAKRGEKRGLAAEEEVKTAERMDWAKGQQARLSPAANTILNQSAAARGGAVADVQGQALAGMKTGQDVSKGLLGIAGETKSIELDTYKMGQLLGEQKERKDYLGGQPESIQKYLGAIEQGMGEGTAKGIHLKEEFPEKPEKEPEAGKVTDRDKFLQSEVSKWKRAFTVKSNKNMKKHLKKVWGWDGEDDTFVFYRDKFIASELSMNPEEQATHLDRFAGVPGQVTKPGTPKTEVAPMEKPTEKPTEIPTEKPTEEFNIADHAPAGEEEKPRDVEAFIIGYIKEGRDVARLDIAKLAADYDMDEEEVRNIVSRFVNTAPKQ